jgi:hypothetical protein
MNDVSQRTPAELRKLFLQGSGKGSPGNEKPDDTGAGTGGSEVPGGNEEDD